MTPEILIERKRSNEFRDVGFARKLREIFNDAYDGLSQQNMNHPRMYVKHLWLAQLERWGVSRYVMECKDRWDGVMMWWDFHNIINETPHRIVVCPCPAGEWEDENSPDMSMLVMSRDIAERVVILGFLPDKP